jgi:outer membrane receptor protein involved in Fe transport
MRRLLLATCLLSSAPALAQQSDEIVVTGHGLDAGLGDEVYDVTAISRTRLTGSATNRLEDVLRDVPSFQNFRRSDARSANPTSQGASLRALGGNASSRALIVLDGVPQSDPFGGWIFWPAYDPRRLGSARIVRGGGSGVDGPGALAGTIELNSAGPGDLDGISAEAAYGSRDSVDAFAAVGSRLGAGYGMVSASYARGDGFIPVIADQRGPVDRRSPYQQASIAVRGAAPVSETVELQASGLWFSDERERGTAFTDISTTGTDASLRLVGHGEWRWSALGYVQTRDFYNSFASVGAGRATVSRSSEQYSVPSTGVGARFEIRPPLGAGFELRIGGDWRRTSGKTKERTNFVNGAGTRSRVAGGVNQTSGAFAEASWKSGALTATAGGRIDHWQIDQGILQERVLATGAVLTDTRFPDRSGWRPTGRAGLAWQPAGAVTLRTAAYLGWRLPTLNELYRPFRVGTDATAANAALKPERLKGFEVGAEYRPLANLRFGVTLFTNRLEDGIANVTLGTGPGTFPGVGFVGAGGQYSQRRNIDAIRARGIELDGALTYGQWTLSAGYSHIASKVVASGAAAALDGRRPAQTPRDSATATLDWRFMGRAHAALTARYVGPQNEDDLGTKTLDDALTFDAVAEVPIAHGLRIQARAENLTDTRVEAGISGAGIVERATPRTFWIGLKFDG